MTAPSLNMRLMIAPFLHPEEPLPLCGEGVTKGGGRSGAILCDAMLRIAPQDEEPLHPEEPRSGVTKGGKGCVDILRDASLRNAPQDEGGMNG